MENTQITLIGETDFRNQKRRFGIKPGDRQRHVYVVGKTGTGKTTLLENMAKQDIQNGRGLAIVDPHGEFAEKMIDFVPSSRINDVIYFNPADTEYPIAFNVMEKVDAEHRHLVASGLVGVFKKIWAESWGPRLEYVLRNAVLALLEYPNSTLLGIMRLLVDKEYRARVMEKVKDPVVKSFWVDEFSKYKGNFEVEAISPIQNKVGQFLTNPLIRNVVGQTKSTIDLRRAMDDGKILIMNLSKGQIGEDASALLGAMMITKLQLAAMSRVDIPESERRDFFLYVDEFQNFATDSFANILSEARKYRLNLTLAHQYIGQLITDSSTRVKDAVFGNVGTMIVFRVGAEDAEFLEKEFSPEFMAPDLVGLGFAQIYLKLMIDGFSSRPFSAVTLPPIQRDEKSSREKIIKVSRERYSGLSRQEVEEKIARWSGVMEEEAEEWTGGEGRRNQPERPMSSSPARRQNPDKPAGPVYVDKCHECGKRVELNFQPDGVRPVYCRECLIKVRSQSPAPPKPSGAAPLRVPSQPVIKESGPTISLSQATGRPLPSPAAEPIKPLPDRSLPQASRPPAAPQPQPKKQRRGPDLSELRSALSEVINSKPEPEKVINPVGSPVAKSAPAILSAPTSISEAGSQSSPAPAQAAPRVDAQQSQNSGEVKELKPGEEAQL